MLPIATGMHALVGFVYTLAVTMGLVGSQQITVNPGLPIQGGTMEVCYTFGAEQQSVKLEILIELLDGTQQTQTVKLTPADPCVKINVPINGDNYLVTDLSGHAPPVGGLIDDFDGGGGSVGH